MGREHEDQHIYLYVCINPVAVFGKEKKLALIWWEEKGMTEDEMVG